MNASTTTGQARIQPTVAFAVNTLEGTLTRITLESLAFPGTPMPATPTS